MMSSPSRFTRFLCVLATCPPASSSYFPGFSHHRISITNLQRPGIATGELSLGTFAPVDLAPTPEEIDHFHGWQ